MTTEALSFNERVCLLLDRVRYVRAADPAEKRAVAHLRYRAYLREGAIAPNPDELFADPVDEYPNTVCVGVHIDGRLAAAIRFTVSLPGAPEIPTASVFPEILRPRLAAGERMIDPTRFVADHALSRAVPELAHLTLRVPWMAMEHWEADTMLAAVRPEHRAFYRRLWGNEMLAEPRRYPGLAKPVALTALPFAAARERVSAQRPWFRSSARERAELFGPLAPGWPANDAQALADAPLVASL